MIKNNKILRILAVLVMAVGFCLPSYSGAPQIMKRASALMDRASGIDATFTMTTGGRSVKGSLKSSAAGFVLTTPSYTSWYDGRNLWTYNASARETTLTLPSKEELCEANPMMMVSGYANAFTAAFAKKQTAGTHTIVLLPKSRKSGLKNVVLVIDSRTYKPTRITVNPASGASVSVAIHSLRTDAKFSKSSFTYPKSKYPKVEVIDLR
ncbi:MAG: outer-membrane lipoprotein carrier protein LolA [Muribaculaceae bacterium]|nr:outer-membrane lipoprotein carrier protein LolA [Muribaculaceae bacterium]